MKKPVLLLLLLLAALALPLPAPAAEAKAPAAASAQAASAQATSAQATSAQATSAQECALPPPTGENAEEIKNLRQQVDALQQQLNNVSNAARASTQPGGARDLAIRIKNLPSGSYRERCFACMTMPDEEGERVLLCTCPVDNRRFDRLSLVLSMCGPNDEISFCAGMLMCGPCKINAKEQNRPILPKPSSSETLDNLLR